MARKMNIRGVGFSLLFFALWIFALWIFSFICFVHVAFPNRHSQTQRSIDWDAAVSRSSTHIGLTHNPGTMIPST